MDVWKDPENKSRFLLDKACSWMSPSCEKYFYAMADNIQEFWGRKLKSKLSWPESTWDSASHMTINYIRTVLKGTMKNWKCEDTWVGGPLTWEEK